ncbi:tenascin-X isoform X4 [Pangasianodon hypophthalmus]|uniref:tenascin-X isoform X4 n=1 Tax=Pangasianodon hypophthalmus TaxID=310915 RepID=UPI000EFF5670|nr:tenascin-X isoform X4 [Pangasianodon hypophthalmus]
MRIISLLLMCWSVAPMWRLSSLASPPNVMGVFVKARTETLLTLEWTKMNNFSYILRYSNGTETPLTVSADGSVLRYTVSSLSPGTKYTFVLYAVFKGVKHSAFNFTAVTSPSNVASVSVKARSETALTFEWSKVKNNSVYTYILRQSNRSDVHTPMYWGGSTATHTVSSLSPGTKYAFTLYTVFGGERSSGYNFSAATMPLNVASVNVTQRFANRLELSWEEVKSNNISYILRHGSKAETTIAALEKSSVMTHTVSSLSPGTRYNFTLYTVFEGVRSRGLTFSSVTGVIAGVILALLFMVFLICLGFVYHRQSVLNRKTQSDLHANQTSSQGAEEGACNAPVLAKQQSSDSRKHLGQRLNKKKSVKPTQENPYSNPSTPSHQ